MVERARCECDHKVFLLITAQFDYKNDLNLSRKAHATSPAQFKHVIASALYDAGNRAVWKAAVTSLARNYHEQVLLDFECFKEFVRDNYSN